MNRGADLLSYPARPESKLVERSSLIEIKPGQGPKRQQGLCIIRGVPDQIAQDRIIHDQISIDTPELVAIDMPLAGIGQPIHCAADRLLDFGVRVWLCSR